MKLAVLISAGLLVFAGFLASSAGSQEPGGIQSPLEAACAHLIPVGESQGMKVRTCRRRAPDELGVNRAMVHVRIFTNAGSFDLDVWMFKSDWNVAGWTG